MIYKDSDGHKKFIRNKKTVRKALNGIRRLPHVWCSIEKKKALHAWLVKDADLPMEDDVSDSGWASSTNQEDFKSDSEVSDFDMSDFGEEEQPRPRKRPPPAERDEDEDEDEDEDDADDELEIAPRPPAKKRKLIRKRDWQPSLPSAFDPPAQ